MSAGTIDQTLRIAIGGVSVAAFRDPVGDSYPVVLRAPRDDVMSVADLDRLYVWNGNGAASPIAELASPQLQSGPRVSIVSNANVRSRFVRTRSSAI